jgi:2,6-dihydroxypyridine 3-monooxygenase
LTGLRIAVVGGSLGGLTAACLLRDSGHDVQVYERSPKQLEQRGAGIGLLRATSKYLVERAGIDLTTISIATEHIRHLGRDGSVLHDEVHRYLFSSWNTVYRALLDHWGTDSYLLGHELIDFDQGVDEVNLRFDNGHRDTVDLLVCADGVGSWGRRRLLPDANAGYAGYVAWRGMVPESDLPSDLADFLADAITYYVYANSHILVYPIPGLDGSVHAGDRLVNFVWYRNYAEGGDLDNLLTDRHGERRELSLPPGAVAGHHDAEARAIAAARLPASLAKVVEQTKDLFVQVVYDIEVERMAFGRVCLLGDAAFAVRPHAAAGTAKAADDGWALDAALSSKHDVAAALERWEAGRLELGSRLLDRSRRVGRRSQVDNNWEPGDPELIFGLHHPGDA